MTALTFFKYGATEVRTLSVNDEPWFVASDVAKILDLGRTHDAVRGLDDDEKGTETVRTPGGEQVVTVVSEPGLYQLVMRSRKPEAKPFRRWIAHEVVPAIRKHGGYLTPAAVEEALADPDTIIRLATSLKEERAARAELEAARKADAPKVLFADAVSTSQSTVLVGDLAKILRGNGVDIGATRLFAVLRETGYLINRRGSDWNSPTQKAMDLGLFRIKETAVTHSDGHVTVNKTPKVTGKGQTYFVERFLSGRIPAAA